MTEVFTPDSPSWVREHPEDRDIVDKISTSGVAPALIRLYFAPREAVPDDVLGSEDLRAFRHLI